MTAAPSDPRVRAFLDELALAVAEDLLRDLRAGSEGEQTAPRPEVDR